MKLKIFKLTALIFLIVSLFYWNWIRDYETLAMLSDTMIIIILAVVVLYVGTKEETK